jgi:hypothetical protein
LHESGLRNAESLERSPKFSVVQQGDLNRAIGGQRLLLQLRYLAIDARPLFGGTRPSDLLAEPFMCGPCNGGKPAVVGKGCASGERERSEEHHGPVLQPRF